MKHINVIAIDLAKKIFQVCVMTKHNKILSKNRSSIPIPLSWT